MQNKTAHPATLSRNERLQTLLEKTNACEACPLNQAPYDPGLAVPGFGALDAKIMIAGEAPGRVESETGKPFVGPSGKVLQECIIEAGIPLQDLYVLNTVKHRPPQNRDPSSVERGICMEKFFVHQVTLVAPKLILCVGRVPAMGIAELAGVTLPSSGLRGTRFVYKDIPVHITWHPAYIMRNRTKRPDLVQDLVKAYAYAG